MKVELPNPTLPRRVVLLRRILLRRGKIEESRLLMRLLQMLKKMQISSNLVREVADPEKLLPLLNARLINSSRNSSLVAETRMMRYEMLTMRPKTSLSAEDNDAQGLKLKTKRDLSLIIGELPRTTIRGETIIDVTLRLLMP